MAFFDNPDNVKKYVDMSEGFDGKKLISELKDYLWKDATLLELGMGPGKDLIMLSEFCKVTGSDSSNVFVENFREKYPKIPAVFLDAVSIEIDMTFDCIYSNKVLHHLSREELSRSFCRQHSVLNNDGILMHSFWYGDKEEFIEDLRFVYYEEKSILKMVEDKFDVLKSAKYTEFEKDDSFLVILKKSRV
ncbi:MAG: methyltransferase domain-containing protein [Deltaproteobacteria bacterium]|nr:methyltransferase domain-containing protein [Deltaproteobacteria bacterium]